MGSIGRIIFVLLLTLCASVAQAQSVILTLTPIQRFVDSNGNALSGGKVFVYLAGTTTKATTYTDSTGATQQTNPIILNSRGEPENGLGASLGIWLQQSVALKFVLAPANDTDPPSNPIWTIDNILPSGNVVGPATSTVGDIATFSTTNGTGLSDSGQSISSLNSVPTEAALAASATTTYPSGVWRLDYSSGLGAVPWFYVPSNSACSLNGGNGDGGSQVPSSDSKCWIAHYNGATADIKEWGAVPGGLTDAHTQLQACLNAVGPGGTCQANAKFLISSSISVPRNETIWCGFTFPNNQDGAVANFANTPALILGSGVTVNATGNSVTIDHCLSYPNGTSFPSSNSSGFAGLAFADNGYGSFSIVDSMILGFDSAFYGTGTAPYLRRVYADGTGVTHAVFEDDNLNTDSGWFEDIRVQPYLTGNSGTSCPAPSRAGTGMKIDGINYIGDAIVQNMQTADYDFGQLVLANKLWSDFNSSCARGSSIGIKIDTNGSIIASQVNINSSQIGIQFLNSSGESVSRIGAMFLNNINQDCIQLGASGPIAAGTVQIGSVMTNAGQVDCGRYVVNYLDGGGNSSIQIDGGQINNSGGSTPYINVPTSIHANQIIVAEGLSTDISPASSLYGATPVACTGYGSGGSCALVASVRVSPWKGTVTLTTAGSPSTSGTVTLTWPLTLPNSNGCKVGLQDGSDTWATLTPGVPTITSVDSLHTTINWSTQSALIASKTYNISFDCEYQ
jgi:hypothetical protein